MSLWLKVFIFTLQGLFSSGTNYPYSAPRCGSHLTAKPGRIYRLQSPGYPNPYPAETRCGWSFNFAHSDWLYTIRCKAFDLGWWARDPLCGDYLLVHASSEMRQSRQLLGCGTEWKDMANVPLVKDGDQFRRPGEKYDNKASRLSVMLYGPRGGDGFLCYVRLDKVVDRGCSCGIAHNKPGEKLFFDGNKIKPEARLFPWVVRVGYYIYLGSTWECGGQGTLVSASWVFTSMSVLLEIGQGEYHEGYQFVLVGQDEGLYASSSGSLTIMVVDVKRHPFSNKRNAYYPYSVGLLKLEKPIEWRPGSRPIPVCLPWGYDDFYEPDMGAKLFWGFRHEAACNDQATPAMEATRVEECTHDYPNEARICAGGKSVTIQGPPQAPTVLPKMGSPWTFQDEEGRWVLLGVDLRKNKMIDPIYHGRVTLILPWIQNIVWNSEEFCRPNSFY